MSEDLRQQIERIVREELERLLAADPSPRADAAHSSAPILLISAKKLGEMDRTILRQLCENIDFQAVAYDPELDTDRASKAAVEGLNSGGCPVSPHSDGAARHALERAVSGAERIVVFPARLALLGDLKDGNSACPFVKTVLESLSSEHEVLMAGDPLMAEGWRALTPGHPLRRRSFELEDATRRLGVEWIAPERLLDYLSPNGGDRLYRRPDEEKPRTLFLVATDIEDAVARGESELIIEKGIRLTPSAIDRAGELGLQILDPR